MENSMILYDKQTVDFIIYNPRSFSPEEIETLKSKTKNDDLKWANFKDADILCDFKKNITSSYIEGLTGELVGFDIRKRVPNDKFYTRVAFASLDELQELADPESSYYSLIDYNVANNNEYIYTIFPVTSEAIGISLESHFFTNWDFYTLTPLIEIEKNIFTSDEEQIWAFFLNCEEGKIDHIQDKTKFTTFAKKPKISIGELDYYESSFQCLLGNVLCNGKYYEPYQMVQKWNNFISSNSICLFKNLKGDLRVVMLEDTAASYENNYREIPTTISFNYTEIMDSKDMCIYRIGSS